MAFGGGPSEGSGSISDINVTPLVDVMLVLLVIFMVTAPILQQGVAIDLPKVAAAPLAGNEEQLVVNVNKAGQVFVRADQSVPYGQVMRTMGAVRESGLTKIGLVTEPPPPERSR